MNEVNEICQRSLLVGNVNFLTIKSMEHFDGYFTSTAHSSPFTVEIGDSFRSVFRLCSRGRQLRAALMAK